ncbi:MAG TPA: tetratricopeptide repeat protein [Woeseiaceae bacterium]|nr:tetratricopeptide repeat protein [Woeseiaceae bacterium]
MPSFFYELRRRNVLRVAAAYALVAWIIIEAGSVLLPTFGATEVAFQIYVIVVLAGFFVAVVLAWIFEITPEGVKLDKDVDRIERRSTNKQKAAMNYLIIGLLAVALGVSIAFNVTGIRNGDAPPRVAVDEKPAIAVLPFTSLSSEPDNAVFADGIHGDILTQLANIGSCRVISRTSVMEYRNTTKNVREIGEELDVGTVLQGSVQRVGDNVRINVQLVDAENDVNIWAETYDRQLTAQNIFDIQSEISRAIAVALETTLTPAEQVRIAAKPTADLRAYSAYISGRDNLYLRRLETLRRARENFEQAIEYDPNYAAAYAGLAESVLLLEFNHQALPRAEAFEIARNNLQKALELDPELADAYAVKGLLESTDWQQTRIGKGNLEAEAAFRRAIELNPNHASAHMWFAMLRESEERDEEAIELFQRSMELDPLGRIPFTNLPRLYAQRGRNDEAIRLWLEAMEIHPEWPMPQQYMAVHMAGLGRLDEAMAWMQRAIELSGDQTRAMFTIRLFVAFGDMDRAVNILKTLPDDHPFAKYMDGFVLLIDSDIRGALEFFSALADSGELFDANEFPAGAAAQVAILAGDFKKAREFVFIDEPILREDTELQVDKFTTPSIIRLAYISQREGDSAYAQELLRAALPVVRQQPRLGWFGQGIQEVRILALLGRKEDALDALRELVDAGFREPVLTDLWSLDLDPFLAILRDDQRFAAMVDEVNRSLAEMYERVLRAESTGDWDSLRAKAEII